MAITEQVGLNKGIQGILGLGASGDDKDKGPSFIQHLYKNDLIRKQIEIAAGYKLEKSEYLPEGHSIECRINAEHPYKFIPSPGRITALHMPGGPGIRVDSHVYQNYFVPPHYDSLIGKVIAFGDTREQALARMRVALSEMVVEGIKTNLPLHIELVQDEHFVRGELDIHYLEAKLNEQVSST